MAIATVELQLLNALGSPLTDPNVSFDFFRLDSSKHFHASLALTGQAKVNIGLSGAGNAIYRVLVTPSRYRVIQFFLGVTEGQTARREPVFFPVDPSRVVNIQAPVFTGLPGPLQIFLGRAKASAFGNLQGAGLYNAFTPLLKAALLNLYSKSTAAVLGDKSTVFSKLGACLEFDQDRLFAQIGSDLLEETMQTPFFQKVDDSLHKDFPPYKKFTSYKTRDAHGNLQLTFSRNGSVGNDYLVDMDIDLSQGIGHAFEVIDNFLTASLTNPYDVREVLIKDQKIQPLYDFVFANFAHASVAQTAGL